MFQKDKMALKDWEQVSSTRWENERENKSIIISERFSYHKQEFIYIVLVNSLIGGKRYAVGGSYNGKEFKTREKANRFVKSYMRYH